MAKKKVTIPTKPKRNESEQQKLDNWIAGKDNHPEVIEEPKLKKTKRFTIDVPEELHRRVKTACVIQGKKMNEVLIDILQREFPELH